MAKCNLFRIILVLIVAACIPIPVYYFLFKQQNGYGAYMANENKTWSQETLNQNRTNITIQRVPSNKTATTDSVNSGYKTLISTRPVVVKHSNEQNLLSPPRTKYEAYIETELDIHIDRNYSFGLRDGNSIRPSADRIPRIIHFMWKTEIIPSVFVENLKTFAHHNPTWTYYFWTDASCKSFVEDKYPHLLGTYQEYGSNVSRADAARYAVVHYYGGAYFDLDTKCIKPLDPLLETEECIVTPEPMEHSVVLFDMKDLLGNCVFLCKPRHGFFGHVLSDLHESSREPVLLKAAGPIYFTRAFKSYIAGCVHNRSRCNENIHLLNNEYFLDYVKPNIHQILRDKCRPNADTSMHSEDLLDTCKIWRERNSFNRALSSKAYTVHLYFGSYDNGDQLDMLPENHIKNMFPHVRIYPYL